MSLSPKTLIDKNNIKFWETLSETDYHEIVNTEHVTYTRHSTKARQLLPRKQLCTRSLLSNSILKYNITKASNTDLQLLLDNYKNSAADCIFWLGKDSPQRQFFQKILLKNNFTSLFEEYIGIATKAASFANQEKFSLEKNTEVRCVTNLLELKQWVKPIAVTYKMEPEETELLYLTYVQLAEEYGFENKFRHYVSFHNNEPIASSTVFLDGSSAGLYNRASMPGTIKTKPRLATYHMPAREFEDALSLGYENITSHTVPGILKAAPYLEFKIYRALELYVSNIHAQH
jgi:hypothetical protein